MASSSVDLFIIGGGINGAAIARDAAGRGLRVMLAERGDYATATSSASSKLIHGGLRYLESYEFGLVRHSLVERHQLSRTAPHLVRPLEFMIPVTAHQRRPAWLVYLGLKLYDALAWRKNIGPSGRLSAARIAKLPLLRKHGLKSVLHYYDCQTDDSRLVLALLLDARQRGADIGNYRDVSSIAGLKDGYRVAFSENGARRTVDALFVVNAAGPWVNSVNRLCDAPPPERAMRLVRGSHIVLAMPLSGQQSAYTLQNSDGRVVFTLPWLNNRYLVIGTTDAPHHGDASTAVCSDEERDYLLEIYNRYFEHPGGPADASQVISNWSGVRALVDDGDDNPSKVSRSASYSHRAQGTGGFISVYGGKLTTHRILAEHVMTQLARLGAQIAPDWTRDAPLFGGRFNREELLDLAAAGPDTLTEVTRRRWVFTYGDQTEQLYSAIEANPSLLREIAPGISEAELIHARTMEDARSADDFLNRRTKLFIELTPAQHKKIAGWFGN